MRGDVEKLPWGYWILLRSFRLEGPHEDSVVQIGISMWILQIRSDNVVAPYGQKKAHVDIYGLPQQWRHKTYPLNELLLAIVQEKQIKHTFQAHFQNRQHKNGTAQSPMKIRYKYGTKAVGSERELSSDKYRDCANGTGAVLHRE
jgi:hypothetical protein